MPKHFTDTESLHGAQADILWEMIANNPNLVRRTVVATNQQMNTRASRIITAINEIKTQADSALLSVENALKHVNTVVGNTGDKEISDKLSSLGSNVIEAMHELKTEIDGILDEAKVYTDEKVSGVKIDLIDGGTF